MCTYNHILLKLLRQLKSSKQLKGLICYLQYAQTKMYRKQINTLEIGCCYNCIFARMFDQHLQPCTPTPFGSPLD